ncbi:response regulator [Pelagibius sp. Alg239-R121]|uniref:response regulator n=1 Tax=Pelagibius sp. Alg239-R121 TaxID=2993448 RepID=UPI0024A7475C|nr:response regulator [Pelagibius sp. Alg239-R121]
MPANDDSRRRLLVIDGDSGFVELAREIGEGLGFEVKSTSKARELATIYEKFSPSVIVFDFFTPGMDGIELVNWLHERDSSAHVLFTSQKESFFLRAAKELALAKGYLNIDVMVEPRSYAAVSDMLTTRLAAVDTGTGPLYQYQPYASEVDEN